MTTAQVPGVYRRFASAIGSEHWRASVERQEQTIRLNPFLATYLRSEYAIAYQLEQLRKMFLESGAIPHHACNNPKFFPSVAFAAQVLEIIEKSSRKQTAALIKRVRTAFASAGNMHGLCLELQAATHFSHQKQRVGWHRASNQGTFDLMIEDLGPTGLEVECKFISKDKGRRIHRYDAITFWNELWKDIADIVRGLRTGIAVVLTVNYGFPKNENDRKELIRGTSLHILDGTDSILHQGAKLRTKTFAVESMEIVSPSGRDKLKGVVNKITGTENREMAFYQTPAGGLLAFVMNSATDDNVLDQVFDTLSTSAAKQFTGTRGALFWVGFQDVDAGQLLSLYNQDSKCGQTSSLKTEVSRFLRNAPDHIVSVVFSSRTDISTVVDGRTMTGGSTYFFFKEESRFWHESFRRPLNAVTTPGPTTLADLQNRQSNQFEY